MAKQRKLPFLVSTNKSHSPFELVHCDLWGPFAIEAYNGTRFFLIIVDNFTQSTWVYLLNFEDQTSQYIQSFFNLFETQFNAKIKVLRIDFGIEFNIPVFLASKGVIHQHSSVATLQQNGTVFFFFF